MILGEGFAGCVLSVSENEVIKVYLIAPDEDFRPYPRHNEVIQTLKRIDPRKTYFNVEEWQRYYTLPMLAESFGPEIVQVLQSCREFRRYSARYDLFRVGLQRRVDPIQFPLSPEQLLHLEKAITLLHQNGIYHGDLNPDNVGMHNGMPVLIDFDLSKFTSDEIISPDDVPGETGPIVDWQSYIFMALKR